MCYNASTDAHRFPQGDRSSSKRFCGRCASCHRRALSSNDLSRMADRLAAMNARTSGAGERLVSGSVASSEVGYPFDLQPAARGDNSRSSSTADFQRDVSASNSCNSSPSLARSVQTGTIVRSVSDRRSSGGCAFARCTTSLSSAEAWMATRMNSSKCSSAVGDSATRRTTSMPSTKGFASSLYPQK